jgi:hypothetical protein
MLVAVTVRYPGEDYVHSFNRHDKYPSAWRSNTLYNRVFRAEVHRVIEAVIEPLMVNLAINTLCQAVQVGESVWELASLVITRKRPLVQPDPQPRANIYVPLAHHGLSARRPTRASTPEWVMGYSATERETRSNRTDDFLMR